MKKRLLSWLLVLTMVISLIPSTLVTTAFAAELPTNAPNLTFNGDSAEITKKARILSRAISPARPLRSKITP